MIPTIKEIFEEIDKEFLVQLAVKTNWGRNEIIAIWKTSKANAAMSLIEKMTTTNASR
jgi:hypothetical protein